MRMPFRPGNRDLLREAGEGARPAWERPVWTVSRRVFSAVVGILVEEFGCVEVITDGGLANKCDTRCRAARGDDCVCSCAGTQHGGGQLSAGEIVVAETTIVDTTTTRWRRVLCRSS